MNLKWHPAGAERRLRSLVATRVRERLDALDLARVPAAERRLRVREQAMEVLRDHRVVLPARELTGLSTGCPMRSSAWVPSSPC